MQNLFGFITYPMELGLIWLALLIGNAGIGIILFTIAVRGILSPLQIVQLRSAKAMQRLQPHLAELRKKHGSDRQKMTQETMALYKEHNVNPAMGCLPTLLQIPILFGLFYGLMHLGVAPSGWPVHIEWAKSACNGYTIHNWPQWYQHCYDVKNMPGTAQQVFQLFHARFLWLSNGLGKPDPLYILPILAGATQWIQSRMMLTRSSDPQQQMMNSMMNFMPLIIIIFAWRYASGLSLYWVTSTVIGILVSFPITGWGLLPVPWNHRNDQGKLPPRPPAKSKSKSRPAGGDGQHSAAKTDQPSSTLAPAPTETDANGQNGKATEVPAAKQVSRPRKKANRARGGRGGRRG